MSVLMHACPHACLYSCMPVLMHAVTCITSTMDSGARFEKSCHKGYGQDIMLKHAKPSQAKPRASVNLGQARPNLVQSSPAKSSQLGPRTFVMGSNSCMCSGCVSSSGILPSFLARASTLSSLTDAPTTCWPPLAVNSCAEHNARIDSGTECT